MRECCAHIDVLKEWNETKMIIQCWDWIYGTYTPDPRSRAYTHGSQSRVPVDSSQLRRLPEPEDAQHMSDVGRSQSSSSR